MEVIIVAAQPEKWPLQVPNVRVVSPRKYITDSEFARLGEFKVFNLCNAFKYQNMGYYVSLLARARGHNPEPNIQTIMDFRSSKMKKHIAREIEESANRILAKRTQKKLKLDIFFGKCTDKAYLRLARELFTALPAPMFRAVFEKDKKGVWHLGDVEAMSSRDIRDEDLAFVSTVAADYVARRHRYIDTRDRSRYSIAILVDENEELPASDKKALAKFAKAASNVGFFCEFITKDDYDRLNEFDALFIRATTNANNYTYTFSRKAYADGIVVVDDPSSIIRCANKVFLAEQAAIRNIPTPKTVIVHKGNLDDIEKELNFPVVIKQPDSQFSQGVFKAEDKKSLDKILSKLLKDSDLLIVQEFVPTKFDWRIGIFDKKPIFACKYYMAAKHWQIVNKDEKNEAGAFKTLPISEVPKKVVDIALKMSNLIGDGLYGADVKETDDGRILLIEVNDNPNIDAGVEDKVAGFALYETIMRGFMDRVNEIRKLEPVSSKGK